MRLRIWRYIVALLGAFGATMTCAADGGRYASSGLLEVTAAPGGGKACDANWIALQQKTHAALLKHDAMLARLLAKDDAAMRATAWFGQFKDGSKADIAGARQDFYEHFRAEPVPDTTLIRVEFSAASLADARNILQEYVDCYLELQRDEETTKANNRTVDVRNEQLRLEMRRRELVTQIVDLGKQLDLSDGGTVQSKLKQMQLEETVRAVTQTRLDLERAKARVQRLTESLQQGIDPSAIEWMARQDVELRWFRQQLVEMDVQRVALLAHKALQDPEVKSIEERRDLLKQRYDEANSEMRTQARREMIAEYQEEAAQASRELEGLEKVAAELRKESSDLGSKMAEYARLKDEERLLAEHLKTLEVRTEGIDSPGKPAAVEIAWRVRPEIPDRPR